MTTSNGYLTDLAQYVAAEWWRAHGGPRSSVEAMAGPDSLAVFIENAFTKAELALAEQVRGRALLRQYADRLFDQVAQGMVSQVEAVTGREVASTGINVDPTSGWIMCLFRLGVPATAKELTEQSRSWLV